jgi:hypothetical protein
MRRLACTRFHRWAVDLNLLNQIFEPQIGRSIRLAREFDPDLVVTVMDTLSHYKHAWNLSRRLRVPLMTITMDDPQMFEQVHRPLEGLFNTFLRRLYADAAVSLGVSHEMCEYLASKFQKKTKLFFFGPAETIQPRPAHESGTLKDPPRLTLGYTGSLGMGYREGLLAVLDAAEATDTNINIYTRDQHSQIKHPRVRNRGFFSPDQLWPTVQAECDVLLLSYSFDGEITRVYRTHFPTKLSDYCWAGMPVLASGPDYATGVRWAERHAEAALSTAPNTNALRPVLERLRNDGDLRSRMAGAAMEIARAEFNPVTIRHRFRELVRQAARTKRAR